MHAYVYVCACMRVYVHVYMYVYACMYVCVYVCICMYVYVCMYVCVHVCIYIYIHTRVGVHVHSCRRILFICTVQSLYYMRVYHRCFLKTCMRVCGGTGSGVCFSLFMVSACYWRGRLCNYLGT